MTTATEKKPSKKAVVEVAAPREPVYPTKRVRICTRDKDGTDPKVWKAPLTRADVEQLLGWEDEEAYGRRVVAEAVAQGMTEGEALEKVDVKMGEHYDFRDMNGVKVRCTNNTRNRPFDMDNALSKMQEFLQGRWRLNGEAMIVDRFGEVISAQHRGVGFVFACQVLAGSTGKEFANQAEHWQARHPDGLVLETVLVTGVDGGEDVVRTIDNVHPQSYADTRYRLGAYGKLAKKDRVKCAKMEDFAIKLLWDRTGVKDDAYAPRRSHAEAQDFLARHPRIEKCVQHIFEEDADGVISSTNPNLGGRSTPRGWSYLTPGTAAGLMYLMGCSGTKGDRDGRGQLERYSQADPAPCETVTTPDGKQRHVLNWGYWKQAQQFWTDLASANPNLKAVGDRIRDFYCTSSGDPIPGAGASVKEKVAILCLAWQRYRDGEPVRHCDLNLEYKVSEDGVPRGLRNPDRYLAGGIDLGWSEDQGKGEKDKDDAGAGATSGGGEDADPRDEPVTGSADGGNGRPVPPTEDEANTPIPDDEYERRKEEARAESARKREEKKNGQSAEAQAVHQKLQAEIAELRAANPGVVLLFKSGDGSKYLAWQEDASPVSKAAKVVIAAKSGIPRCTVPADRLDAVLAALWAQGRVVAVVEQKGNVTVVTAVAAVTSTDPLPEPETDPATSVG